MTEKEKIEKKNKAIVEYNEKLLKNIVKEKQKRHVKEQDEPVFANMIKEFRVNYAKTVVVNSINKILKYVMNEI